MADTKKLTSSEYLRHLLPEFAVFGFYRELFIRKMAENSKTSGIALDDDASQYKDKYYCAIGGGFTGTADTGFRRFAFIADATDTIKSQWAISETALKAKLNATAAAYWLYDGKILVTGINPNENIVIKIGTASSTFIYGMPF